MPGIKGLKKGDRPQVEKQAEDFIRGAADRVSGSGAMVRGEKTNRQRAYERYTFSLTPAVSADIDRLSLVSREFRINRSEVVKAGIEALKALSEDDLIEKLRQVKQLT